MKSVFKEIFTDEVMAFRMLHMRRVKFIYDRWDDSSLHFGCYLGESLAGTIRLTPVRENRLPFKSLFPDVTLCDDDIELGRLLVAKNHRAGRVAYTIFQGMVEFWSKNASRFGSVYIAPTLPGNIKPSSYEHYGFQHTGKQIYINKGRMQIVLMVRKEKG